MLNKCYALSLKELREIQRREFDEAKRQQREDEQRLEERKRAEVRRKREMVPTPPPPPLHSLLPHSLAGPVALLELLVSPIRPLT